MKKIAVFAVFIFCFFILKTGYFPNFLKIKSIISMYIFKPKKMKYAGVISERNVSKTAVFDFKNDLK